MQSTSHWKPTQECLQWVFWWKHHRAIKTKEYLGKANILNVVNIWIKFFVAVLGSLQLINTSHSLAIKSLFLARGYHVCTKRPHRKWYLLIKVGHPFSSFVLVLTFLLMPVKMRVMIVWRICVYTSYIRYNDVMIRATVSQIISVSIVCSTVCSGVYQRKHQSSASPVSQ